MTEADETKCSGCGTCVRACGVDAIETVAREEPGKGKKTKQVIKIDTSTCLGCGICVTRCKQKALTMTKRKQRLLHDQSRPCSLLQDEEEKIGGTPEKKT